MRQFVLPEEWDGSPRLTVGGGRARYLARVLRLAVGDEFPAIDARGGPWLCAVIKIEAENLELGVSPRDVDQRPGPLPDLRGGKSGAEPLPVAPSSGGDPPLPFLTLVQGIPKGAKMDQIVRQAAEAGVARIIPLESLRACACARAERWDRIVREALQQSGSPIMTRVERCSRLGELSDRLGAGRNRVSILLHESPLARTSLHGYLTGAMEEIVLCVGPEGGFAPEEVEFLIGGGFSPFRFPGAVLRAETAAIYAIAATQVILA
ncbi:MAG: RsmE family RNA methyltransferase, partial [Spirochaetaceae bacterium]|nr:RsmE family RNA methyltransferase [Spirochaetaceae bacterium]